MDGTLGGTRPLKVRDIDGLVRTGALLAAEADELQDARESVWRVRNLLHLRAAGHQDVLRFGDKLRLLRRSASGQEIVYLLSGSCRPIIEMHEPSLR